MTPKPFRSKFSSAFFTLAILFAFLMGCGAPAKSTATPQSSPTNLPVLATPTVEPPTDTPGVSIATQPAVVVPTLTDTPVVVPTDTPALPSPTATVPVPTASSPTGGSVAFANGTNAVAMLGSVAPGQVVSYTLQAAQYQPLTLILGSDNKDATLGVLGPDGSTLLGSDLKLTRWQMALPFAGTYTLQVYGGAAVQNYSLTIKAPQMVNFASGANSITLPGTTVNGYLYAYSIGAGAGQSMTASLDVPATTAYIDIYGLATGTLLSPSDEVNTWTGNLPQSQDYIIEVVPVNGQTVNYHLTVSVTGTPIGQPISGGNIVFTPNTTATVLKGSVQPGQVVSYTVQAGRYQPMILLVQSDYNDVTLGVIGPDGFTLLSQSEKWAYWQIKLPLTGVYTLQVVGGAKTERYTLTVKIGKIVYFPTGSDTVTVYGTTHNGYVLSYAFFCSEGQVMTVSLNVPATKAYLDVFGIETGSLLSYKDHATSWTGTLPKNQEYVVEVIPAGGYLISFALTVTIP